MRYSPTEETRSGHPSSHVPIRAERSAPGSHAPPPGRNETIGDRPNLPLNRNKTIWSRGRPLNRKTPSDRPTPLTIPQRTTYRPEHTIERGDHDSQTSHEDRDARIDDEPFHHEAHGTSASATTTRKPVLRPHPARVIERAGERDVVAESHFNLTFHVGWVGMLLLAPVTPSHTTSIPFSSSVLPISSIFS